MHVSKEKTFFGICNDNAPQFRRTKTVEIMIALDPDTASDEAESSEDARVKFVRKRRQTSYLLRTLSHIPSIVVFPHVGCVKINSPELSPYLLLFCFPMPSA